MIINVYKRNKGEYDKFIHNFGLLSEDWKTISDNFPQLNDYGKYEYEILIEGVTVELIRSDANIGESEIIKLTEVK